MHDTRSALTMTCQQAVLGVQLHQGLSRLAGLDIVAHREYYFHVTSQNLALSFTGNMARPEAASMGAFGSSMGMQHVAGDPKP